MQLCQTGVQGLSLMQSLLTRKEKPSSSKVWDSFTFYIYNSYLDLWILFFSHQDYVNFISSGAHLWNGFSGPAQPSNEFFKELDEIHNIGHVDAAFRMHNIENPDDHDHIYFFLV